MQPQQALGERHRRVGRDDAVGHVAQAEAVGLDHAPARVLEAGVEAKDADEAAAHG